MAETRIQSGRAITVGAGETPLQQDGNFGYSRVPSASLHDLTKAAEWGGYLIATVMPLKFSDPSIPTCAPRNCNDHAVRILKSHKPHSAHQNHSSAGCRVSAGDIRGPSQIVCTTSRGPPSLLRWCLC